MSDHDATLSVSLDNCHKEPIHIPGAVQPHGILIGVEPNARFAMASANYETLADALPALGSPVLPGHLGGNATSFVLSALTAGPDELAPMVEGLIGDHFYDVTRHWSDGVLIVELEPRPTDAPSRAEFALAAQDALTRLQEASDLDTLLQSAADQVRRLTGFDRVMTYRFLEDGAGEVVGESRSEGVESFLGLRYPASDIPDQARRLYTLNPLRLITNVSYESVPILPSSVNPMTGRPLDMSHCVLRSVSPIHVEYLTNMGVGASMSISIVIDGKLWGLLACHHASPRFVTPDVRMSCGLLSRVLALLIHQAVDEQRTQAGERARSIIEALVDQLQGSVDLLAGLVNMTATPGDLVNSDGFAVSFDGRVVRSGLCPDEATTRRIVEWLGTQNSAVNATARLSSLVTGYECDRDTPCGMLATTFHMSRQGHVIWFRREQVRELRWGGNPEKTYAIGPNGPRLTPRGSFAEWKELARGQCEEWTESDRETAQELARSLQTVVIRRLAESERTRDLFVGMLGHDLRNPLSAITVASEMLRSDRTQAGMLGARIATSTSRMKRLVDLMLDFSKVQANHRLPVSPRETDVHRLVTSLVRETRLAYPGSEISVTLRGPAVAHVDGDRLAQVVTNLLSNARHHGDPSKAVTVIVDGNDDTLNLSVANEGVPISKELGESIFEAFRSSSHLRDEGSGVGLGLYISREIVREHGGHIRFDSSGTTTTFHVSLPRR